MRCHEMRRLLYYDSNQFFPEVSVGLSRLVLFILIGNANMQKCPDLNNPGNMIQVHRAF